VFRKGCKEIVCRFFTGTWEVQEREWQKTVTLEFGQPAALKKFFAY